jgi:hypothetical protein
MSINFAVHIANVKFQYPRARGGAKVLLAHPTPGSILRGFVRTLVCGEGTMEPDVHCDP